MRAEHNEDQAASLNGMDDQHQEQVDHDEDHADELAPGQYIDRQDIEDQGSVRSARGRRSHSVDAGDGRGVWVYQKRSWVRRAASAVGAPFVGLVHEVADHARAGFAAATRADDDQTRQRWPRWVLGWKGKTVITVGVVAVFVAWWQVMLWML